MHRPPRAEIRCAARAGQGEGGTAGGVAGRFRALSWRLPGVATSAVCAATGKVARCRALGGRFWGLPGRVRAGM